METLLTNEEAELYDRQIRLWGLDSQTRIRKSKVLMLGFNGVASEVAKILVLAGIDTLTIVDNLPVQDSDIKSNLFCSSRISKDCLRTNSAVAKIKTLNPSVKVTVDNTDVMSLKSELYQNYDLVTLHSHLSIEEIQDINDKCRTANTKFYMVLDFGYYGFMFNDLGREFKFQYEQFSNLKATEPEPDIDSRPRKKMRIHSPTPKKSNSESKDKQTITDALPYVTFRDMVASDYDDPTLTLILAMLEFYSQFKRLPSSVDEDLKILENLLAGKKLNDSWKECIYGSLSSVCAIAGGIAGQDMIRALSGRDIPICNTFVFDGSSMNGKVQKVGMKRITDKVPIIRDILEIDDDDDDLND